MVKQKTERKLQRNGNSMRGCSMWHRHTGCAACAFLWESMCYVIEWHVEKDLNGSASRKTALDLSAWIFYSSVFMKRQR